MENRYTRTEMLIGKEGVDALRGAAVIVFGVGGVGGYAVEALARAGVGHIAVVDSDAVSLSIRCFSSPLLLAVWTAFCACSSCVCLAAPPSACR